MATVEHHAAGDAALEADLRAAIEDGGLEVHYQANVDAIESEVIGFEALVRWQHPDHGSIGPGRFIPIAERSGLITGLGAFVLRCACEEGVRLQREVPDRRLTMSVNLSAHQLADDGIVDDVSRVLTETGLDPSLLCLELTESVLVDDLERVAERLTALRALGVCVAIDDFGTGYSSLAHLKRFHADILKIDRTFVDGLGRDHRDTEIVRAIVSIAQSLNIELIAEGVEHAEQLEQLLELGCTRMQGYFWSAPVRAGRLIETIERIARLGSPGGDTGGADAGPGPAEQALLLLDHELRNPLTVISGYLDLFEQTEQGARSHVALAAMRRALVTMTRTLESFGSVHALEGDGRPLQLRPLAVAHLVETIVEELTPVLHDKKAFVTAASGGRDRRRRRARDAPHPRQPADERGQVRARRHVHPRRRGVARGRHRQGDGPGRGPGHRRRGHRAGVREVRAGVDVHQGLRARAVPVAKAGPPAARGPRLRAGGGRRRLVHVDAARRRVHLAGPTSLATVAG